MDSKLGLLEVFQSPLGRESSAAVRLRQFRCCERAFLFFFHRCGAQPKFDTMGVHWFLFVLFLLHNGTCHRCQHGVSLNGGGKAHLPRPRYGSARSGLFVLLFSHVVTYPTHPTSPNSFRQRVVLAIEHVG